MTFSSVTLTIVTVVVLVTTLGRLYTCFLDDFVYCFTTDLSSLESETKVISKDASVNEIEIVFKKFKLTFKNPFKTVLYVFEMISKNGFCKPLISKLCGICDLNLRRNSYFKSQFWG